MTAPRTRPMPASRLRRMMAAPGDPKAEAWDLDGGTMDPTIARVLLRCRESVAQATETAIRELRDLGVDDDDAVELAGIGWRRIRRGPMPRAKPETA